MELIDKKVYRLDCGDFYSLIIFSGQATVFGFSQDCDALLNDTIAYARRYKHGDASVLVYSRSSLGARPFLVSEVRI